MHSPVNTLNPPHSPVKGHFIPVSIPDMSVHHIITHIHLCALHPLDVNGSLPVVEVVIEELFFRGGLLPVELLNKTTPEGMGIGHGEFVLITVGFKIGDVRLFLETVRWMKNAFLC